VVLDNVAERLSDIIQHHLTDVRRFVPAPAAFADTVRHTRNYYTHFDERARRQGKVAEGEDLILATFRMRALLQIIFLRDLGLPQSAVDRVVAHVQDIELISL
jgi:hypothetical protein